MDNNFRSRKKKYSHLREKSNFNLISVKRISSSSRVRGLSCTSDEDGNVYILGQYFENMFADNIFLTTGASGIFLAQIGKNGQWKWATTIHNHQNSNDINMSCQIMYSKGFLYSAMVIRNGSVGEGFVIKTDKGGNIKYSTRFTGTLNNNIRISIDRCGNAYIVNSYTNLLVLTDKIRLSNNNTTLRGYVAKLNKDGKWLWATDISGNSSSDESVLNDIATTPDGRSYVVGYFVGKLNLGDIKISSSNNAQDFIMAEISSNGKWIRAETFSNGEGSGIEIDDHENIYLVGGYVSKMIFCGCDVESHGKVNLFVAKLNCKWKAKWVLSTKYDNNVLFSNINITLDDESNVYIDGIFNQPLTLGKTTLTPRENNNEFIAQISSKGSWLWVNQISGNDVSASQDITVDLYGNLYITGSFDSKMVISNEKKYKNTKEYAPGITTLYLLKYHPSR